MLYNEQERTVMAAAIQPNMRSVNIELAPFRAIVADFGLSVPAGGRVLDIGPGQCDMLDLLHADGVQTVGLDFDPAICELGRLRGHQMHQANLSQGWPEDLGSFDAIFCRGSLNVHWFAKRPAALLAFLDAIAASLRPGGWIWIAPWNKPGNGDADADATAAVERVVADWSAARGICIVEVPQDRRTRYGVGYSIPRVDLWTKRVVGPAWSRSGGSMSALWDIADYAAALRKLQQRGDVEFITYDDLDWGDDRDYKGSFPGEWKRWKARISREPAAAGKVFVLIQHDTDSGPAQSVAMAELEAHMGVRSSIMSFARWQRGKGESAPIEDYPIDWQRLHALRERGFTIGYHCNALHLCNFDEAGVFEAFDRDMDLLAERGFNVEFFSPHGGAAAPATGALNSSFDYPEHCRHRPRWVFTRYGPRFDRVFSDGGYLAELTHGKEGALDRFIDSFLPGRRYKILIHSQRYDCARVPEYLAQAYVLPAVVALVRPAYSTRLLAGVRNGIGGSVLRIARKLFSHRAWYRRLASMRNAPAEAVALRRAVERQREQLVKIQAALQQQRERTRQLYLSNKDLARRLKTVQQSGQGSTDKAGLPH